MKNNKQQKNKQQQAQPLEQQVPKKNSLLHHRADEYIKESGKIEDYPDEKRK